MRILTLPSVTLNSLTLSGTGNLLVVDTSVLVVDATNNRVGILTASPSQPLSFGGETTFTAAVERRTTADSAGSNLDIKAGGATSGATNRGGGTLRLFSGTSTGSGTSTIEFYAFPGTAGATSDNSNLLLLSITSRGLLLGNSIAVNSTTDTASLVYGTASSGGAYPFTEAGNLVLQSRASGAARDIVFITGTSPAIGLVLDRNQRLGLAGVTAPTNTLSLSGQAARTIWMERHVTANTAGNNLTLQSGGATSAATDKKGGDLNLASGLSTGNALPGRVHMKSSGALAATGTSDQTQIDRHIFGAHKVLTDGAATDLVSCTIASGSAIGGVIHYAIEVTDGTDYQAETGYVFYNAVNKSGTVTRTISESADTIQSVSSGALTSTWAISNASPAVISVNANTDLASPSTGYPRITFSVFNGGQQAIALA